MVVLLFTSLVIPHELLLSNANLFFHLVFSHSAFYYTRMNQFKKYIVAPLVGILQVAWFCLFMFGFVWAICYFAKPY